MPGHLSLVEQTEMEHRARCIHIEQQRRTMTNHSNDKLGIIREVACLNLSVHK